MNMVDGQISLIICKAFCDVLKYKTDIPMTMVNTVCTDVCERKKKGYCFENISISRLNCILNYCESLPLCVHSYISDYKIEMFPK